jgi:solute carrier family 40 (iron-regulated transporter), member 1
MSGSNAPGADEYEPLLSDESASPRDTVRIADHEDQARHANNKAVSTRIARRFYISHFLSTWNSRVFEFGAALYLATIFPHTLLPLSVYALVRGLAAILFSPVIGQYIDKSDRLQCVRLSIGMMRCCARQHHG